MNTTTITLPAESVFPDISLMMYEDRTSENPDGIIELKTSAQQRKFKAMFREELAELRELCKQYDLTLDDSEAVGSFEGGGGGVSDYALEGVKVSGAPEDIERAVRASDEFSDDEIVDMLAEAGHPKYADRAADMDRQSKFDKLGKANPHLHPFHKHMMVSRTEAVELVNKLLSSSAADKRVISADKRAITDTERLDWIEANSWRGRMKDALKQSENVGIRAAIDQAMMGD